MIEACTSILQPGWLELRLALWPGDGAEQHLAEMAMLLADPQRSCQFVAYTDQLVRAVREWACERGCRELVSDALLDNEPRHAFHRAMGFEEIERVVDYRKLLS